MRRTGAAAVILLALVLVLGVRAQTKKQDSQAHGHGDSHHAQELAEAVPAMSGRHHKHEPGPHMYLTTLREPSPADQERANQVVEAARRSLERWKDYRAAQADGFEIFLPHIPQKMYHFTNWRYALEAAFRFNPEHPTSLLYEKTGDGYRLIGAMYTAPARFTEEQVHERIPLSIAQWHKHVNICRPPRDQRREPWGKNPRFGLLGSIATKEECEAAGGTFIPQIFGWMVHLYPYEKTADAIWSVERQLR